jgi:hypothetical protein
MLYLFDFSGGQGTENSTFPYYKRILINKPHTLFTHNDEDEKDRKFHGLLRDSEMLGPSALMGKVSKDTNCFGKTSYVSST